MRRRFQASCATIWSRPSPNDSGRTVDAFLSDNIVEPDVAVEVFILRPRDDERRRVAVVR